MNAKQVPSVNALYPSINGNAFRYYNDVIQTLRPQKGIGVILVAHSYETVFALASSVSSLGNLRGVVLKNSTHVRFPEISQKLAKAGIPVLNITKDEAINQRDVVADKIDAVIHPNEPFVIMDHGGYFAFGPELFERFPPERLLGVAEHTLNGEERYRELNVQDRPIISIGQSPLKLPSDEAAADAIILASDMYMQSGGINLNSPMLRVGIIGYGRLGGRIGQQLAQRGISRVLVNDINHANLARMRSHSSAEKEQLCQKCDVIFCATGNSALSPSDYAKLKNNTIIFTVTSPDDELNLGQLIKDGVLIPVTEKSRGDTYVYRVAATGNEIILPFNGESPNTSLPYGISDPVIHQTYAAHIAATISAMNGQPPGITNGLQPLAAEFDQVVSKSWIKHFGHSDDVTRPRPRARRSIANQNGPEKKMSSGTTGGTAIAALGNG